jgi:hypothetical protein
MTNQSTLLQAVFRPFRLEMQSDNNLVLYTSKNNALWDSSTYGAGKTGAFLSVQNDRNLVVYDGENKALWASLNEKGSHLSPGATLEEGQYLLSPDRKLFLRLQNDGNLVCYTRKVWSPDHAIWSTKTYTTSPVGPYRLIMQDDNNLVLYDGKNKALWATGTYGKGKTGANFHIQNDRNLVVYDGDNKALWASLTDAAKQDDGIEELDCWCSNASPGAVGSWNLHKDVNSTEYSYAWGLGAGVQIGNFGVQRGHLKIKKGFLGSQRKCTYELNQVGFIGSYLNLNFFNDDGWVGTFHCGGVGFGLSVAVFGVAVFSHNK